MTLINMTLINMSQRKLKLMQRKTWMFSIANRPFVSGMLLLALAGGVWIIRQRPELIANVSGGAKTSPWNRFGWEVREVAGRPFALRRIRNSAREAAFLPVDDAALAQAAALPWLEEIEIVAPQLSVAGLQALAVAPKLRSVYLAGNEFTNDHLPALEKISQLKSLSLETPEITDAGLPSLQGLQNLEHLTLPAGVTDQGARLLPALPKLTMLVAANTQLTDAGLKQLPLFPQLKTLCVGATAITNKGLPHLQKYPTLEKLDLSRTEITPFGLDDLRKLPKLQHLMVNGTPITLADVGAKPWPALRYINCDRPPD